MDEFKFPWEREDKTSDSEEATADEEFDIDLPWNDSTEEPGLAGASTRPSLTGTLADTRQSQAWEVGTFVYVLTELSRRLEEKSERYFYDCEPFTLQYIQFLARQLPQAVDELKALSRLLDFINNCKFNPDAAHSISQQLRMREIVGGLLEPLCDKISERVDRCGALIRDGRADDVAKKILTETTQSMERQLFTWHSFAAQLRGRFNSALKRHRAGISELERALAATTNPHLHISKLSPFFNFALSRDKDGGWIVWSAREALARASALEMPARARDELRDLAARVEAVTMLVRENISFPEPRAQSVSQEIPALLEQMFQLTSRVDLDPKKLLLYLFTQTGKVELAMDEVAKSSGDEELSQAAREVLAALKPLGVAAAQSVSAYRAPSTPLNAALRAIG